jgi:hypothetical protein
VFGQFIKECCELGERYVVKSGELWDEWRTFAHEAGVESGSKKHSFPDAMRQRGFRPIENERGIRGRGWCGLKLKQGNGDAW